MLYTTHEDFVLILSVFSLKAKVKNLFFKLQSIAKILFLLPMCSWEPTNRAKPWTNMSLLNLKPLLFGSRRERKWSFTNWECSLLMDSKSSLPNNPRCPQGKAACSCGRKPSQPVQRRFYLQHTAANCLD